MTFQAFLQSMPGLQPHAIGIYLMCDEEATRIGNTLKARNIDHKGMSEEYRRRDLIWLSEVNAEQAIALETDVRLAAIPALRAWAAGPDGIGNTWVNWYVTLLYAHIEQEAKRPVLVAAE